MFEHALALDPRSAEAQSSLADALAHRVLDRLTDAAAADMARAQELADRALATSPRSLTAHLAKGIVLRALLSRMRHEGCGGRAGRAELLNGIESASSRPVRRIVLRDG